MVAPREGGYFYGSFKIVLGEDQGEEMKKPVAMQRSFFKKMGRDGPNRNML